MKRQFVLLEKHTMEELRDYEDLRALYNDLKWKAPESFWIGIVGEGQAYTIPQILKMYEKEFFEFEESDK